MKHVMCSVLMTFLGVIGVAGAETKVIQPPMVVPGDVNKTAASVEEDLLGQLQALNERVGGLQRNSRSQLKRIAELEKIRNDLPSNLTSREEVDRLIRGAITASEKDVAAAIYAVQAVLTANLEEVEARVKKLEKSDQQQWNQIDDHELRIRSLEDGVAGQPAGDHWVFGGFGEYRSVGGDNWGASAGFGYHWNFGLPLEFMVTFGGLANEHLEDPLGSYSLRFGVVPSFSDAFEVGLFGEYAAGGGADGPKVVAQHLFRVEPRFGSGNFAFAPSCAVGHREDAIPGLAGDPDGFGLACSIGVIARR